MKASKSFGIAMILFTAVWAAACVIFAVFENILWENIIMWICEIFLIIVCVQCFRQKLRVNKFQLEYTPIFGKSRKTAIENIDYATVKRTGGLLKYKIYVQNKRFCSFANTAVGATKLLEILKNNQIKIIEN